MDGCMQGGRGGGRDGGILACATEDIARLGSTTECAWGCVGGVRVCVRS